MLRLNKIRLGWIAFIFVVWHILSICIYAFPTGYLPPAVKNIATVYVHPVFEQTWSLFAPCPIHDTELKVKYYFEQDSTDWIEPLSEVYGPYSKYRFTWHGDLAVGESNLLYFIGEDLNWMGISRYAPFPKDSAASYQLTSSYWMTRSFIYGSADFLFGKYPQRALAECTFRNVKTGESGVVQLPEFLWIEE